MLDAFLAATEGFLLIVGAAWMFFRFIHAFPPVHSVFTLLYRRCEANATGLDPVDEADNS